MGLNQGGAGDGLKASFATESCIKVNRTAVKELRPPQNDGDGSNKSSPNSEPEVSIADDNDEEIVFVPFEDSNHREGSGSRAGSTRNKKDDPEHMVETNEQLRDQVYHLLYSNQQLNNQYAAAQENSPSNHHETLESQQQPYNNESVIGEEEEELASSSQMVTEHYEESSLNDRADETQSVIKKSNTDRSGRLMMLIGEEANKTKSFRDQEVQYQ